MMMLSGAPRVTPDQIRDAIRAQRRAERYIAAKIRDEAEREKKLQAAVDQLYAERMRRPSNPATVRCPPEDAALARRIVSDWITWECDMARRFGPFGVGAA